MSMLYVTHDFGVLAQIADQVGVMYAGRMVEIAPSTELFTNPRHPYTRGLIASIPDISKVKRAGSPVLRGLLKRDEFPAGCPFQPRCDYAIEGCAFEVQLLDSVNASHQVACMRWKDLETGLSAAGEDLAYSRAYSAEQPILLVENVNLGYGGRGCLRAQPPLRREISCPSQSKKVKFLLWWVNQEAESPPSPVPSGG